MPVFNSKKAETPVFELLTGDFPFEIVAVDNGVSTGPKTRGSDTREVKLKFFSDNTFAVPRAQWTENFIYHESTEWKVFVFAKCAGFDPKDGDELDIDASWVGRRGWATCRPEEDGDKSKIDAQTNKVKRYNRVQVFITNKKKLAPNAAAVVPKTEEDMPPF